MEIARGNVGEKPFARFVYKLGAQRFTGDLILTLGAQEYRTSWEGGQVIAAVSPSPADSIGRVALNAGLATTTLLGSFLDQARRQPDRDQLELFAEIARLHPDQALDLKRRLVAQQALRIFGVPGAGVLGQQRPIDARRPAGLPDRRPLAHLPGRAAALPDRSTRVRDGSGARSPLPPGRRRGRRSRRVRFWPARTGRPPHPPGVGSSGQRADRVVSWPRQDQGPRPGLRAGRVRLPRAGWRRAVVRSQQPAHRPADHADHRRPARQRGGPIDRLGHRLRGTPRHSR